MVRWGRWMDGRRAVNCPRKGGTLDAYHFDALARRLSTLGSRRSTLGGILAAMLLPLESVARGNGKHNQRQKGHGKDKGNGKDKKAKGRRKDKEKGKGKGKGKDQRIGSDAQTEPCWRTGACSLKKGANASRCNLAGYNPTTPPDCTGCNISRANLRGANLSGANLTKANLSGSCLIGANLTGAIITNTTNLYNAILCRTTMPDGSVSDAGCGLESPCCPVCDATHACPAGQLCCDGRCEAGNCCADAACGNQYPICVNFTCSPCTSDGQCDSGEVCCNGQCLTGTCCTSSQCIPPQTCGGGGTANVCECTPKTCQANRDCGSIPTGDGCGGPLNCGACSGTDTCGGGGTPNVCGCTPTTTCPAGQQCGSFTNNCGVSINCGPGCPAGQQCDGTGKCFCSPTGPNQIVLANCSGICVDTNIDSNNCGGCGNTCPVRGSGQIGCNGGTCCSAWSQPCSSTADCCPCVDGGGINRCICGGGGTCIETEIG